ncbi:phage minor head protein [Streptomyces althioticus]|uniref:phage minor head protein n=1 Tax=Streptomyces althioticus TaxID=83380 RepID=UPI0037AC5AF5
MPDDIERQLADAEETVAREVAAVLDELAAEIAEQLAQATEIVAARFSLSRIGRAWTARLPRIVRRLLGVAETAAAQAADDADTPLPDGWDDLPGRHERGEPLPASLGTYVEATEHLLRAVGDRLTEAAVAELAEGLDAGEDTEQLRARLRAMFSRDGAQLGTMREERIARTEAARAWNAATLAAAEDVTDPGRPLVKQWTTRRDARVRDAHDAADGQIRLLDETFTVGGVPMRYPGDPTAPASLTVNCRCILRLAPERQAAAYEPQDSTRPGVYESKEVTAAGGHTGAMIALVPAQADAERLAVDGGEPVDELHCTLLFLGDADGWDDDQRARLIDALRTSVDADLPEPVHALAFGVNQWNPASDDPAWVYAVGDDPDHGSPDLRLAHLVARDAIARTDNLPEIPRQHSPWVAHTTAAYAPDRWPLDAMNERLGPVTYDRLRIAFAGDTTDIPLGSDEEAPPVETTAAAIDEPPILTWSTPDGTALAFENTETGDGRVFASGALFWEGAGPWPLQYADEMSGGHDGAELAGAINEYGRDGDRITGSGVLYLTQRAGAEAAMLLAQGAPLGVSVDLDDVDIELVDTTQSDDGSDLVLAAASFPSMSVRPLPDGGGWMLTASAHTAWTASAGGAMTRVHATTQLISGPGGRLSLEAAQALFPGAVTAAAGDRDNPDGGIVVHSEQAGDYLIRITRGRVRGATLVSMPAFDQARIVLDDIEPEEPAEEVAAAASDFERVIAHVSGAPVPVAAREVAEALKLPIAAVRRHLARAAEKGRLVRISRGLYTGPSGIPEGNATASTSQDTAGVLGELEASAWQVMQQQPPMPAAWFREPTIEELPPNSGGVHYKDGRVYGWVAQAGVPHEVHGRKVMIDKLGKIDTSYFLRAKFPLDDGTEVAVGTITMNVGHHRDGFECETAACQFDDSRTVAGIVTVGMNKRGMWFSGAAAPWLSDWDLTVFRSLQPSYHMTQGPGGTWQLKAVLSVPVPAHPSRLAAAAHLAATAVVERSNLALTAAAAALPDIEPAPPAPPAEPQPGEPDPAAAPGDAGAELAASLLSPAFLDRFADALARREAERAAETRAEIEQLAALVDGAAA